MGLSVLMSVYNKEEPDFLRQSLDSLVAQNVQADEVVIVRDGPLGEDLESVLASYERTLPIATVQLAKNLGLGPALSVGLRACRNELIARMDSDDICLAHRFERQLLFLEENPKVAAVGAAVGEFFTDPGTIAAVRRLPCDGAQVRRFAKFRNPLNHMTVMFRRSAVLATGGYRHVPGLEDYDLWVRMLTQDMDIQNIPEILVLARCGSGMARRRGGIRYMAAEIQLYRHFWKIGFISASEFALSLLVRAPIRVMPAAVRPIIYRAFLRQKGTTL
ncbi:MAG: glycosyltransferase [Candidatus Acidiferrales bacterium]